MDRIIRERECRKLTGLSRTTRWSLERRGRFPTRRRLSDNTVGWLESELDAWIRNRRAWSEGAPTRGAAAAPGSNGAPRQRARVETEPAPTGSGQ